MSSVTARETIPGNGATVVGIGKPVGTRDRIGWMTN